MQLGSVSIQNTERETKETSVMKSEIASSILGKKISISSTINLKSI